MEFHIARALREQLGADELLFSYTGNVVFANVAASRRLAANMTALRTRQRGTTPATDPEAVVHAGQLFAMGLIDELSHAMVDRYRRELDPSVMAEALRFFSAREGAKQFDALLLAFTEHFPNTAILRGKITAQQWLAGSTDGKPHRESAFEELLLLWLANQNPAFQRFCELFSDKDLRRRGAYQDLTAHLDEFFATRPPFSPEMKTLIAALKAPMLAAPDSLSGQLDYIRIHWQPYLGEGMARALLAIDTLREEEIAIWMQFHPPSGKWRPPLEAGGGREGFLGDEYRGFDEFYEDVLDAEGNVIGRRRKRYAHDYQAPLNEYEAFSTDQQWMPTVVLIAKSTYVWLEQLSKKYGRHIQRLDQIPTEELQLLKDRGMTALWLIGLWERSRASQTIKRLRGQADAVASAYSLMDYRIADDIGGNAAYEVLRERASSVGLRLASDMVPNHMGLDSNWVIEHPEWFLRRDHSPFPSYSFEGPDLSTDPRVEIKIEDHYYDQTDAAVVYRLRYRDSGNRTEFIYHGNDGTTFAWNDTAQLDYSQHAVREHVIQVILQVARQFPIIRFDAAMVLAKRHVQRLWFPLPGVGGSIPSRAENAMTQDDFERLMPNEFWREVVDRVQQEVPNTLLLAEAFWLLEGYFVRTLGMHRVYNSAFMVMLRDEENAKYRSYLKKTIEFDPDILKRYVNFMSNPDERTAIDQFGTGDKYFGVATMMATIPGLPMFAHGQIEGFTEKYGMEYKQARMDEWPNDDLVARHQREIAPLLKRRALFAESEHFVLYDFWTDHGTVDENVFAYSNRLGNQRALILYNNAYASTRGTVHLSAADMNKATGELRQRSLKDALALPWQHDVFVAYRDTARNLEFLRRASDIDHHGLAVDLRGYQYMVLLEWRELRATEQQPWDRLCDALQGSGVYNLDEALTQLRLRPLSEALRRAVGQDALAPFATLAESYGAGSSATSAQPDAELRSVLQPLVNAGHAVHERWAELEHRNPADTRNAFEKKLLSLAEAAIRHVSRPGASEHTYLSQHQLWTQIIAAIMVCSLPGGDSVFDSLQLRATMAEIFSQSGFSGQDAWRASARVRLALLHSCRPGSASAAEFWSDPDAQWLAGVNEYQGVRFLNREATEQLLAWLDLADRVNGTVVSDGQPTSARVLENLNRAGYRLDRLLELLAPAPAAAPEHTASATSKAAEALPGPNTPAARKAAVKRSSPTKSAGRSKSVKAAGAKPAAKKAAAKSAAKPAAGKQTARKSAAKKSSARKTLAQDAVTKTPPTAEPHAETHIADVHAPAKAAAKSTPRKKK